MGDVLAFFDWEHSANGPTEAINGRLETLRGIASDTCPYTPKSEEPDNLLYDEDATYSAFRPYQQN